MSLPSDPFQAVYSSLADLVAERAGYDALVATGNQERFDGLANAKRAIAKPRLAFADSPTVRLMPGAIRPGFPAGGAGRGTSGSVFYSRAYQFQIYLVEKYLAKMTQVEWQILKAMEYVMKNSHQLRDEWPSGNVLSYVKGIYVVDGSDPSLAFAKLADGWASSVTVDVGFVFSAADFQATDWVSS